MQEDKCWVTEHSQAPKTKLPLENGLMRECRITAEKLVGAIQSDSKCPIIRIHMFDLPSLLMPHYATIE